MRCILLLSVQILFCNALIIPQEVPSLMSLIFSTIPQVRKGTDSRIGFGFRFGDHADFQVLYELGPQKDTKPIGGDSTSSNNKRHITQEDYVKAVEKSPNKDGTSYLMAWSNDMITQKPAKSTTPQPELGTGAKVVQTVPLISESALRQLQLLYKKSKDSNRKENMEAEIRNSNIDNDTHPTQDKEAISEELSNVNLD